MVRRIVTTRSGGVSEAPFDSFNLGGGVGDDPVAVEANRARLAAAAGLPTGRIVWMQQVHGTRVVPVDGPGPLPGTDGIVTTRRDLALAVLVADCVPILAVDPVAGVIGAAHAGRRGAADGIGLELLTAMTEAGADPAGLQVLLGPAICGRCYEVPADLQAQVEATLPGSACETADGTSGVDLRAGLAAQFAAAGAETVLIDQRCTREDPDLFSHRRSGRTGRQAGLIWMPGN
ncbi:peptidoglycan editing factor PgeF [Nakamurella lactea]|uniref:peptidoglycan editing factor PgeF n=1 Tax=Nakamurella lactea TaxID=459515 RepID=UPI00048BFA70